VVPNLFAVRSFPSRRTRTQRPSVTVGQTAPFDDQRPSAGTSLLMPQDPPNPSPRGPKQSGLARLPSTPNWLESKLSLIWFRDSSLQHMLIRSDSQSAIARASHTGPGPGQRVARLIECIVRRLPAGRSVQLEWVKGHSGILVPGPTS